MCDDLHVDPKLIIHGPAGLTCAQSERIRLSFPPVSSLRGVFSGLLSRQGFISGQE